MHSFTYTFVTESQEITEFPGTRNQLYFTLFKLQAKYLESYEKQKGHCTQLADDPEIMRAKQNAINASNISYQKN